MHAIKSFWKNRRANEIEQLGELQEVYSERKINSLRE